MKVSSARKAAFCEALVRGQTPEGAAKMAGVDRATAYRWKAADPAFAEQWDDARERKVEMVETTLYRMAVEKDLGAVIAFLRAYKPEVYNRKMVVAVGGDPNAPPVSVDHRAMIYPLQVRAQIEGKAEAEPEPLDVPVILQPSKVA